MVKELGFSREIVRSFKKRPPVARVGGSFIERRSFTSPPSREREPPPKRLTFSVSYMAFRDAVVMFSWLGGGFYFLRGRKQRV